MTKVMKIKGILIAGMLLLVLGWLVFGKKQKTAPETVKAPTVSPTPTEIEQRYSDDTGAIYISPTKKEKTEIDQIVDLRKKSPMETDEFVIDFDYNQNVFVVEFKDGEKEDKEEVLAKWRGENSYGEISLQYFEIRK